MQNLRLIKNRIKSAKNIAQITKAMELVSASKMRRAMQEAESGKLYAEIIREMVMRLGAKVDLSAHPLLKKPKVLTGKRLIILISTNKGMCGGLNSTLFRKTISQYPELKQHSFIVLGQKGAVFVATMGGEVIADFSQTGSFAAAVEPISTLAQEQFLGGMVDAVDIVYNEFVSVLKQEPRIKQLLPLSVEGLAREEGQKEEEVPFLIEPDPEAVLQSLLPEYVENQIRDAVLQAEASEHAARMVAMRNATDNANSFISDLTLVYNKIRQEKITTEIADLVTARAAIVQD